MPAEHLVLFLPCSTNQTEKTVASKTFELPFTTPCDIVGKFSAQAVN
jgi:hypothetical protein